MTTANTVEAIKEPSSVGFDRARSFWKTLHEPANSWAVNKLGSQGPASLA